MTRRTVLITGSSSGFGKLTAKTFAAEDWNVVATMRRPDEETDLINGDSMLVAALDVTDADSIDGAVSAAIDRFGTIDVLVNNAGYGGNSLFEASTDTQLRAMFETNVFGTMNVCRAVLPVMRTRGGGTVVNVTSMTAIMPIPLGSIYTASKFAAQGFTEALNLEYRPMGITVRAVLPGAYPTQFGANSQNLMSANDDQLQSALAQIGSAMSGIQRVQQDPQEVADKIYDCATKDMPIINPCGADAEHYASLATELDRDQFLKQLATLFGVKVSH